MSRIRTFFLCLLTLLGYRPNYSYAEGIPSSFYEIKAKTIVGHEIEFSAFQGKVVLIVNVASKCGLTDQYKNLESIYEKYQDQGFFVLGFPSNDFMNQEPGTDEEIALFCRQKYNVTFPMFSKIDVIGPHKHALYRFLTSSKSNHDFSGEISWNFNKFLIDRHGTIVARFGSMTSPDDPRVIEAIEQALNEKI